MNAHRFLLHFAVGSSLLFVAAQLHAQEGLTDPLAQLTKTNPFQALSAAPSAASAGNAASAGANDQGRSREENLRTAPIPTAIFTVGGTRFALVDGKRYQVGDILAPGIRVAEIAIDSIVVESTDETPTK